MVLVEYQDELEKVNGMSVTAKEVKPGVAEWDIWFWISDQISMILFSMLGQHPGGYQGESISEMCISNEESRQGTEFIEMYWDWKN